MGFTSSVNLNVMSFFKKKNNQLSRVALSPSVGHTVYYLHQLKPGLAYSEEPENDQSFSKLALKQWRHLQICNAA